MRRALAHLMAGAAATAALSGLVAVAPAPSAAAADRGRTAGPDGRSTDELAQHLVEKFFDLLKEPDVPGLRKFLSPAFLRQQADGSWYTKAEYLKSPPAVASYEVLDLDATRSGSALVARYDTVVDETIDGRRGKTDPAPRLSVFVKGPKGWQLIAHANFNVPVAEPVT